MEVFDKVTAEPDAAGLDADRFSGISGDAARGRADCDDVRAFERALAGDDKVPAQSVSRAPREAKRSLKEGADFSWAEARASGAEDRPEGRISSGAGAGAAQEKSARDPAPSPAPGAAQGSDQKSDPKPALKSGESGEAPCAQLQEEPRRGGAKGLDEEAFLAAMFGRGAQGPGALAANARAASPAASSEASAPKGAALGEVELSRLVDRILVGSPEKGGSEVRLVLADRVLPDTEIRLSRDAAGALQVTVETRDEAAFQTLVGARNDLERALQAAERGGVSLEMRREGGDEGDMRRRSRGLDEPGRPG